MKKWGIAFAFFAIFFAGFLRKPVYAVSSCTLLRVVNVNFGIYNPTSADDSNGSITYSCTGSASVTIYLGPSSHGNKNCNPRQMLGPTPSDLLSYNLYTNATYSTIWGDGSCAPNYYSATPPNGQRVTVTIYGQIPSGQYLDAGTYTDAVTVTLNF